MHGATEHNGEGGGVTIATGTGYIDGRFVVKTGTTEYFSINPGLATVTGSLRLSGGSRYLYFNGGHGYIRTETSGRNLYFQTRNSSGSLGTRMMIRADGNVNIGTTSTNPGGKLNIRTGWGDWISFHSNSNSSAWGFHQPQNQENFSILFYPGDGSYKSVFSLRSNGNVIIGHSSGNVIIGKTSQSNSTYKLDVNGKIRANEIVVNTTGADFVFEDDYNLPSLGEVETFIQQNRHLPGVPSAATMQQDGMGVSEVTTILLQKIEELTLYVIEQQKEIEALRGMVTGTNR